MLGGSEREIFMLNEEQVVETEVQLRYWGKRLLKYTRHVGNKEII